MLKIAAPSDTFDKPFSILTSPIPFHSVGRNNFRFVGLGTPSDFIAIFDDTDLAEIRKFRRAEGGHLLPVVNLSHRHHRDVDLTVGHNVERGPQLLSDFLAAYLGRARELASWAHGTHDPAYRLLAHLWLSRRDLRARYAAEGPKCISHGDFLPAENVQTIAEQLTSKGLLQATHFDRLHCCPGCGSSRLNVREECEKCRSAETEDVGILHHYRCAYLGPEQDFERPGNRLVCPKCAKELRHYGTDYERSGEAVLCGCCGHLNNSTAVGFVCMDCLAHYDAAAVPTRDFRNYMLTDAAHDLLTQPRAPDRLDTPVSISGLPLELVQAARVHRADGHAKLSLCEIRYDGRTDITTEYGVTEFKRSRAQFLEMLQALLADNGRVVPGGDFDYVLLGGSRELSLPIAEQVTAHCSSAMKFQLGVRLNVVDAADVGL